MQYECYVFTDLFIYLFPLILPVSREAKVYETTV